MTVRTYRKRSVDIQAVRYAEDGSNKQEVIDFLGGDYGGNPIGDTMVVVTLEGDMRAQLGDWLIRGVAGEHYPCRNDIFEQTYDLSGWDSLAPVCHYQTCRLPNTGACTYQKPVPPYDEEKYETCGKPLCDDHRGSRGCRHHNELCDEPCNELSLIHISEPTRPY